MPRKLMGVTIAVAGLVLVVYVPAQLLIDSPFLAAGAALGGLVLYAVGYSLVLTFLDKRRERTRRDGSHQR